MAIGIEASRLLTYLSAWEADQGRSNTYYASIAKALASDVAMDCTTNAVQVKNIVIVKFVTGLVGPLIHMRKKVQLFNFHC